MAERGRVERLSTRYDIGVPCQLIDRNRRGLLRRRGERVCNAVLADLSIGGAGIVVETGPPSWLSVGLAVDLVVDGCAGQVIVRHIDTVEGRPWIGTTFAGCTPEFEELVHGHIADRRGDERRLANYWNSAG